MVYSWLKWRWLYSEVPVINIGTYFWSWQDKWVEKHGSGVGGYPYHTEAETRWPPFSRHFQMHFLQWKCTVKISLMFVPKAPINNILALVQIMAWRRPGDKPLSEPMMVSLLTHICVTRPQWVIHVYLVWIYYSMIDLVQNTHSRDPIAPSEGKIWF